MYNKNDFIGIIQNNGGLIYKVVKVYTNNKEDGKDLYQDIVYQLWKAYPFFRNEAKVSTWMYRIALNTSIAHLNKEKKKGSQIPIDELLLNMPDIDAPEKEEQSAWLFTEIRKLSAIEKAIMLLHLDGKSYDEIAAITGFSNTNVGTRLARIKQKIKIQLT